MYYWQYCHNTYPVASWVSLLHTVLVNWMFRCVFEGNPLKLYKLIQITSLILTTLHINAYYQLTGSTKGVTKECSLAMVSYIFRVVDRIVIIQKNCFLNILLKDGNQHVHTHACVRSRTFHNRGSFKEIYEKFVLLHSFLGTMYLYHPNEGMFFFSL